MPKNKIEQPKNIEGPDTEQAAGVESGQETEETAEKNVKTETADVKLEKLETSVEEAQKEFMQAKKDWGEYKTALWRIGGIFKGKEKNKVKQRYKQAKTNYETAKKKYIEKGGDEAAEKIEVMERFGQLGISMDELKKIEGFKELSTGRQALIAENLKQLALGRIQAEAAEEYRKKTVDARFAARMWKGISKEYQIAKIQKAKAEDIMEGGMKVHKEVLQALVKRAKDGPEVKIQEDGTLEMQYVTSEDFKDFGLTKEQRDKINDFNEIATKFSKTPMKWRNEYEGKKIEWLESKKFKQYKKIEQDYEDARQDILELKKEQTKDEQKAALYVNEIDKQIHLNQFLNSNPEVEKELKKIKNKKAWMAAMKSVATERGLYSAAGFITRTATISLLGIPAAPLAAGALAGWRARARAKEALKEKEAATRRKKIETEEEKKREEALKVLKEIKKIEENNLTEEEKDSRKEAEQTLLKIAEARAKRESKKLTKEEVKIKEQALKKLKEIEETAEIRLSKEKRQRKEQAKKILEETATRKEEEEKKFC